MTTQNTHSGIGDLIGVERQRAGSAVVSAGNLIKVPLEKLDDNPFQHRSSFDNDKIEELASSIKTSGLLQAIAVRRVGDRFQIIAGHRRREAVRRLFEGATDDDERQRWRSIEAKERTGVDDEAMARLGLIENLQRDDPSALDAATGLADYQQQYKVSTADLAERLGLDLTRVKRLLQLHAAPAVIKQGVTHGLMVPVLDEHGKPATNASGREKREHRRLDFIAALQFMSLYTFLAERQPKRAEERVENLIKRALEEGWSLRRIQAQCADVRGGRRADAPDAPEEGAPEAPAAAVALVRAKKCGDLVIARTRIAQATPEQRDELRTLLAGLLAELDGRPQP